MKISNELWKKITKKCRPQPGQRVALYEKKTGNIYYKIVDDSPIPDSMTHWCDKPSFAIERPKTK